MARNMSLNYIKTKMYIQITTILIFFLNKFAFSQNFLSNLQATETDPIYTTYVANTERSEFIIDQGYQFVWYIPDKGVNFETDKAGNLQLAFKIEPNFKYLLKHFYKKPTITASYSDLVKYFYYPYENIKCDAFFLVYSSRFAIHEITIINESQSEIKISLYPYLSNQNWLTEVQYIPTENAFIFKHVEEPDGWTIEHNVPYQRELMNVFMISTNAISYATYPSLDSFYIDAHRDMLTKNTSYINAKVVSFQIDFYLKPNDSSSFKIIRAVHEWGTNFEKIIDSAKSLFKLELKNFININEKIYSKIPRIKLQNPDYEMIYWNAFNLLKGCMLPPEGKCSYNYYVYSREPTWGWGHAGQVFHESLSMLAYVYMDPQGAMNSQRIYMERQLDNGYINYRTGPYLDETIPYNNQYTTSAPWFNWENWEIYKVTQDKDFLREAYESGKKFYKFWLENRDADKDGLCEWGGHAVLESVRDGYVAVWDQVGWPSNFEALDLNCMLVMEAKSLANMARELGREDEYNYWINEANKKSDLINKYMWDEETGFYYHVHKIDHDFSYKAPNDLKRKEIIGFLPLWAGIANQHQAEKLIQHLLNPAEFWREYGVPTLSAADKYYNPHGYWNGPVWVQWQYLIFRGLLNYGYFDIAKKLTEKVLNNIIYNLKTNHWFWELYSPDDNWAGWNKTYIWTGIIARFLIDLHQIQTNLKEDDLNDQEFMELEQNFPNPFNESTTIKFKINEEGHYCIKIYDLTGKEVKRIENLYLNPGDHYIKLHLNELPSGFYLYTLMKLPFNKTLSKKMMVIK
jgi:hypothetical protein